MLLSSDALIWVVALGIGLAAFAAIMDAKTGQKSKRRKRKTKQSNGRLNN